VSYLLIAPRKGRRFWTVRITLPGQRAQELGTKCERKSDARAVADRLHTEAATAQYRITLQDAIEQLIGLRLRKKRSLATIEKTTQKGAALIGLLGAERNIMSLSLQDMEDYAATRRVRGVSDSTIAMELAVLMSALAYQQKKGRYPLDPKNLWPEEIAHGSGPARKRWLPWDEYLRILFAIDAEWKDHLTVYVGTGLRLGELYRLKPEHLRGKLIEVQTTKTKGKDGSAETRLLPPNGDAYEVLHRRAEKAKKGQPLFPNPRPTWEAQEVAWHRALSAACEAAKVAHASTNDLRRTFCSWCWQQGIDEALVIKWMGHKSSRMVREVYAQPSIEQHEKAGEKIPSRKAIPAEAIEQKKVKEES
jgi:integrase